MVADAMSDDCLSLASLESGKFNSWPVSFIISRLPGTRNSDLDYVVQWRLEVSMLTRSQANGRCVLMWLEQKQGRGLTGGSDVEILEL
jgi:hypothetical protein